MSRTTSRSIRILGVESQLVTGGAERAFYDLFTHLDPSRFEAYVACCYEAGATAIALREQGLTVFEKLFRSKYDASGAIRLARLCVQLEIDILYTSGHPLVMFWGQILCSLGVISTTVSSIHSTGGANENKQRLLAKAMPSSIYVALSEIHREYLERVGGIPASRIRVISNGIDLNRFRPLPASTRPPDLPVDVPLVGIVAMLRPEKAHDVFLDAVVSISAQTDAHFVIVGDGPQKERIKGYIQDRQLAERVHMIGTRNDVPEVLNALDVVVLCSKTVETLPISVMEAMACGKPVVATNVGSVASLVKHELTGLLVDIGNAKALGESILRLLKDTTQAEAMGQAARDIALKRFSRDSMVEQMQRVFVESLSLHSK